MMKKRFIFSLIMLLVVFRAQALPPDTTYVEKAKESYYDKRVHRYRKHWAALIPTQFIIQNAGNMGVVSAGLGWDYGNRRQWETDLLFGGVIA